MPARTGRTMAASAANLCPGCCTRSRKTSILTGQACRLSATAAVIWKRPWPWARGPCWWRPARVSARCTMACRVLQRSFQTWPVLLIICSLRTKKTDELDAGKYRCPLDRADGDLCRLDYRLGPGGDADNSLAIPAALLVDYALDSLQPLGTGACLPD